MRVCKKCMRIAEDEPTCPVCNGPTSQYFSGYIAIIDPEKSQIAKRMSIKAPGEYALKVR